MKKLSSSSCSSGSSGGNGGGGALRGHWKPCEDMKLQELVSLYGPQNWNLIAQKLQGRSGKSCRLRWFNQLDPRINRRPFSGEEEARLMAAQAAYGNRWAAIARLFPGRTDNSLKNHWHVITARRSRRSREAVAAAREPEAEPDRVTDRFQEEQEERFQGEEERFRPRSRGAGAVAGMNGQDDGGESNGGGDSGSSSRSTCCNSFDSAEPAGEPEDEEAAAAEGATKWLLGAVDRAAEPTAQMKKPQKKQPSPFIDFLGLEVSEVKKEDEEEEEEEEEEEKKKKFLTCNFFFSL